jgi:hypothetical protein
MEHYGGYPDYAAEPYSSIRAAIEAAAIKKSPSSLTASFYYSKLAKWLCVCGQPGKLIYNVRPIAC